MSKQPIPKQIDKTVRRYLRRLPGRWKVVKSKDHYFLYINGKRVACVGNNGSGRDGRFAKKTIAEIQRNIRRL